jgi:hypothetical protein
MLGYLSIPIIDVLDNGFVPKFSADVFVVINALGKRQLKIAVDTRRHVNIPVGFSGHESDGQLATIQVVGEVLNDGGRHTVYLKKICQ